jgi:hypothetical protein
MLCDPQFGIYVAIDFGVRRDRSFFLSAYLQLINKAVKGEVFSGICSIKLFKV